jgi:PAS domain S-box-containing protein
MQNLDLPKPAGPCFPPRRVIMNDRDKHRGQVPGLTDSPAEQGAGPPITKDTLGAINSAILDSLPAHIAVLDPQGTIIAVNEKWLLFGSRNGLIAHLGGVGVNYLDACTGPDRSDSEAPIDAKTGILSVIEGRQDHFTLEYPCNSDTEERWFRLEVTPYTDETGRGAVVMHTNITSQKRLDEERSRLIYDLNERVKESAAIHKISTLLRNETEPNDELFRSVADIVKEAMQYPEITAVRISSGSFLAEHESFSETNWILKADLSDKDLGPGSLKIAYLNPPPGSSADPFLSEERQMLASIAEALKSYLVRQFAVSHLIKSQERLQKQNDAVRSLTRSNIWQSLDERTAFRQITETVARTLEVERLSIWHFTDDNSAILARDLFQLSTSDHKDGMRLEASDFPSYFAAIAGSEVLAADDALNDPRTCEFRKTYLEPLGIVSMLDAPIMYDGEVRGVICAEQVGQPRTWTLGERAFVVSVANLVSLMIAQRARMQSEARIRTILDSEPECVKIVSSDGQLVDMNPAGLRMVEADELSQVVDQSILKLIHPDDSKAFLDLHMRCLKGEHGTLQFRITGLKGTERWMETHSAPLKEPDGTIKSVLSVTRDISQRRESENALLKIAQAVSKPETDDFYFDLTRLMVDALGAKGGAVLLKDISKPRFVSTLSFIYDSQRYEDVCYDTDGTPCEDVIFGIAKIYDHGVQTLFPRDKMLVDFGVEAYAGVPLRDQAGEVIGLIAALYDRPIDNSDLALSSLRIIAERVSSELDRRAKDKKLESAE